MQQGSYLSEVRVYTLCFTVWDGHSQYYGIHVSHEDLNTLHNVTFRNASFSGDPEVQNIEEIWNVSLNHDLSVRNIPVFL